MIQKLNRASLTLGADTWGHSQSPVGRNKETWETQSKSDLGPLHAHRVHMCKRGPSSEWTRDSRAFSEQNRKIFSCVTLSAGYPMKDTHCTEMHCKPEVTWWMRREASYFKLDLLFFNVMGSSLGSWGKQVIQVWLSLTSLSNTLVL